MHIQTYRQKPGFPRVQCKLVHNNGGDSPEGTDNQTQQDCTKADYA